MQIISETNVEIHPITKKALDIFVEKVKENEGDNLLKIVLFGSVARGEANKDSDIDVLVILNECNYEKSREISDISVDVMQGMDFDDNAYIQVLPISLESSKGLGFYALMHNVNREGVVFYGGA